jgi:hypothetical protein
MNYVRLRLLLTVCVLSLPFWSATASASFLEGRDRISPASVGLFRPDFLSLSGHPSSEPARISKKEVLPGSVLAAYYTSMPAARVSARSSDRVAGLFEFGPSYGYWNSESALHGRSADRDDDTEHGDDREDEHEHPAPVPLPGSVWLLAAGIAGVATQLRPRGRGGRRGMQSGHTIWGEAA